MRQYIDIINEAFGQRNADAYAPVERQPPTYLYHDVMNGRKYRTAEEYADNNIPITRLNTDPRVYQTRYEGQHQQLMDKWNSWVKAGYIVPGQTTECAEMPPKGNDE